MSRIQSLHSTAEIDYDKLADDQRIDEELKSILSESNAKISIKLKLFTIPGSSKRLFCDYSTSDIRPFVTNKFRNHNSFRPYTTFRTPKNVLQLSSWQKRFVWPGMQSDIAKFIWSCMKKLVDTHAPMLKSSTFEHIHIYLIWKRQTNVSIDRLKPAFLSATCEPPVPLNFRLGGGYCSHLHFLFITTWLNTCSVFQLNHTNKYLL